MLKKQFWLHLSDLQNTHIGGWLFTGVFNTVLGSHEKRGNSLRSRISCEDFLAYMNVNHLIHLNAIGTHFTWSNGRIGSQVVALKLDHTISNQDWLLHKKTVSCCTLVKICSDHNLKPFMREQDEWHGKAPFKFYKAWITNPGYERLVKEVWNNYVIGNPTTILQLS